MKFTKLDIPCPNCHKPDLWLHPSGRMCGCDNCKSIFYYPSMQEKEVLPQESDEE